MSIIKRADKGSALSYNEMDANFNAIAPRDSATGAIEIPAGTTGQQPASPIVGQLRFNIQLNLFEGYFDSVGWTALVAGVGGEANQNAWAEIAVAGQSNVAADQKSDLLTFIAGTNISIITDAAADSITFNNTFTQDFAYSSLTGTPSTFTPSAHNQAWSTITSTPTTIAGYGITDASTTTEINSAISTAVTNLVDSSPATLDTLNELAASLGDDPNFATTVSTQIGTKWTQDNTKISNWDTSYSWGNHASAGYLTSADKNVETLDPKTAATGTVTHNLNTAAVFHHSSINANFTVNFTNADATDDRTTSVALILVQGGTAYMPTAVQIGGAAQAILWQGGSAPSGTANGKDIVSFTLVRESAVWTVLGSATSYS